MRVLLMIVAAAGVLITAAPASAQYRDGFSVRIESDGPRRFYRDDDWDRRHWRRGFHSFGRGDCRDITIRRQLPDGSMSIRRVHRCD